MARTPRPGQETQITLLAGKGMPKTQIAAALGIHRATVTRTLAKHAEAIEIAEHKLQEYQGDLQRDLPNKAIVERLKQLVADTEEPMASMRAIEHRDRILGFLGKENANSQAPVSAPMFELPPGSQVGVLIKPPPDEK